MTQYLKTNADIENGPEWSLAGSAPGATFWESLDGDSGANPPTSDGDVRTASISNGSLAGAAAPFRLRVALGSPTGDPIKHTGHLAKFTWRRVGAGSFGGGDAWPPLYVYQNGTVVAGPIAQTRPGTTYTDITYTLLTAEAAAITDYTQLEIGWADPSVGAGSLQCLITRAWMELPPPWSLEANVTGLDSFGSCANFVHGDPQADVTGLDSFGSCGNLNAAQCIADVSGLDSYGAVTLTAPVAPASPAADVSGLDSYASVVLQPGFDREVLPEPQGSYAAPGSTLGSYTL